MSKSVDLRLLTVLYRLDGHTCAETAKIFHVSVFAVHAWVQKYQETGGLSDKPLHRGFKKIDPEKLRTYMKEHQDATQQEIKEILPGVLGRLGEMSESETHLPGLSTGLSAIDRKIMGLNRSDLILLAARPGMGKTSLALNIALNVARSGEKTVAVFSLEMSKEQLTARLLSREALVQNRFPNCGHVALIGRRTGGKVRCR